MLFHKPLHVAQVLMGSSTAAVRRTAARILRATANPDGPALLERGREVHPTPRADLDSTVVEAVLRLARLSAVVADELRDAPDPAIRRSAAVLAARAHPVLAGLDD